MKQVPESSNTGTGPATPNPLKALVEIIRDDSSLRQYIVPFASGEVILREGERRELLWFLLEGELQLTKQTEGGEVVRLDRLGPGEVVGILSYYTRGAGFFGVEATRAGRLLTMEWEQFDRLEQENPKIFGYLGQHIRHSSMERYRRLVRLHIDLERSNQALDRERQDLRKIINELEHTRERLIQREKLATIGEIIPGLAHELNNPAASLSRNADYLEALLNAVFDGGDEATRKQTFWQAGLRTATPDTRILRKRLGDLESRFPSLPRPLLRRMAVLPPELIEDCEASDPDMDAVLWEVRLRPFEAARFLHVVRSATTRIERMVQSLKRYTRPKRDEIHNVDPRNGLEDTLLLLGSRLRDIEINTDFTPAVFVRANEDELNQVWTNLIVNAAEAMEGKGSLYISCHPDAEGYIKVVVADTGPGIPESKRDAIFEPHYTTKAQGGDFGLGLGLNLSRLIIEKYGGEISVETNSPHGARFVIRLPQSEFKTAQNVGL